jgi:DNA-binding response OmpR family regulator
MPGRALRRGGAVRILLVEDEDGIASFVIKGLSAEGHCVERTASVQEAVGLALTRD